jgi:protein phosphatase
MSESSNLQVTFEAHSDVGRERSENQDAFGSHRGTGFGSYFVCDGMGGHAGGSTASRLAVSIIEQRLAESQLPLRERIEQAIREANDAIHEKAFRERELRGMGTTIVFVGIDEERSEAYVAHVGDSRVYHLRGKILRRVTKDHTMVQRLVDEGLLTEEQAEHHPNSNIISRSLGGRPEVEVEFTDTPMAIQDGDLFVLCSDGLHGLVTEMEIARIASSMPPAEAVRKLIDRANEEGGHDNITAEILLIGAQAAAPDRFELVKPPVGHTPTPAPVKTGSTGPMGSYKTARTIQMDVRAITGENARIPEAASPPEPALDEAPDSAARRMSLTPAALLPVEDAGSQGTRSVMVWVALVTIIVLIVAVAGLLWQLAQKG